MSKKLIVLSFDALQGSDIEQLAKKPYFSQILKRAAFVRNVREVYPSLTYPIHTTLVTGVLPKDHGVFHNQQPSPSPDRTDWNIMGSDWFWYKNTMTGQTLPDAAFDAGLKVATVLWPVMAGEKRWTNVPEIWPMEQCGEEVRAVYEQAASADVLENYADKFFFGYDWSTNEDMLHYGVEMAYDILRRQKPDLLMCHVIHLDHVRHHHGDQGPEVDECLRQLDIIAGRFMEILAENGDLDNTNVVILGDHGQIDVERAFQMNVALVESGLVTLGEDNTPADYVAYSFSAGFSTQIILKNPDDQQAKELVYQTLCKLQAAHPDYIDKVFTAQEMLEQEGLVGPFSFVVEGTKGTEFLNHWTGSLVFSADQPEYPIHKATHGHHPSKGDKPPFIAFGPDVIPGEIIEHGDILDVCPTLCTMLGVEMPAAKGQAFPMIKA